jgi:hypothetical protein
MHHALLGMRALPVFAADRAAMWAEVEQEVGPLAASAAKALPADMPSGMTVLAQWMASSSSLC